MSVAPTPRERAALARARELALNGRGRVSPNPLVGAVVLRGDETVGEGWHEGPGLPHAEVMALRDAGYRARGATVVCTLEPCSHTGRTPPCTDALLAAGVARVVVGCLDPLERTRGQGVVVLHSAGVDVARATGADERACRELNDAFITAAVLGRPLVTLKMATSLDGKVATVTGESRWISGPDSRALVHRWRADHDAVLVGIGTALADDPLLTVRGVDGPVRDPARVVVDTRARLPVGSALARSAGDVPVVVVVGDAAPEDRVAALREAGVDVVRVPGDPVDLGAALAALGGRGIQSVFVEGGADLADALVRADLVDVVRWFVAPVLIGGREAPPGLGGAGARRLADAPRLRDVTVERIGEDVLVSARVRPVPGTATGEGD